MKRILFLALAFGNCIAQAASVHIVDGSTRSKTVHVLKSGNRIEIPAVEMQVAIGASQGEVKADILMLHDPQTGLFLWRYQNTNPDKPGGIIERFEQDSLIVAMDDRLVVFQLLDSSLWVRESREKFSIMSDGQRAVMTHIERFGETTSRAVLLSYREVNLVPALDVDFLYERGNPHPLQSAKLREVSREVSSSGPHWRVVLEGPNGDDAVIIINEQYKIEGTELLK